MDLKITKKKILAIVIVLIVLSIAFAAFYASIRQPDVEVTRIRFKSLNPEQASITFLVTIDVYNPNIVTGRLNSIDVDVYINDQFIGVVDQEVNKDITASGHTTLTLDFVLYNVPIITSREFTVKVQGVAKVSVWILDFTITISETENVEIGNDGDGGVGNEPPVAVIDHNAGIATYVGHEINFDGSGSYDPDGEIFLYEWDFGDDSPKVTGEFVQHSFDSPGEYTITLVVYDMLNDSGSDTDVIRVVGII